MSDREHEDLKRELGELGSRIEYPPTPDVARTVRRRLDAEPTHRRELRSSWLRALITPKWAAAAAMIVLLSLAALVPAIRSTVTDSASRGFSGDAGQAAGGAAGAGGAANGGGASGSLEAQYGRTEASAGAAAAGGSLAARSSGEALGFADEITEAEARARVGKLLLPEAPELAAGPREIYAGGSSEKDGVVLIFGSEPGLPPLGATDIGLLLAEVPGDLESAYPALERPSGPRPEEVQVGDGRGYWISDGRSLRPQPGEAESLPGGALLWEKDNVALLMRADVPKEEAIRIAEWIR